MNFNLDEQIFLKNDTTNKVYTLTINKNENQRGYNVTREWTVPDKDQLASKTDSFPMFIQAAELMEHLYTERIQHGYIEVMRRQGIKKRATEVARHKIGDSSFASIPNVTPPPGPTMVDKMNARHTTTITDRMSFGKKKS